MISCSLLTMDGPLSLSRNMRWDESTSVGNNNAVVLTRALCRTRSRNSRAHYLALPLQFRASASHPPLTGLPQVDAARFCDRSPCSVKINVAGLRIPGNRGYIAPAGWETSVYRQCTALRKSVGIHFPAFRWKWRRMVHFLQPVHSRLPHRRSEWIIDRWSEKGQAQNDLPAYSKTKVLQGIEEYVFTTIRNMIVGGRMGAMGRSDDYETKRETHPQDGISGYSRNEVCSAERI